MPEPSLFRHYQIVQDTDGRNVELVRDARQVAVLAFDTKRLEFVHCHVLLEALADRPAFDKACRRLQTEGHPLLARMLDYGEDEGNPYFITSHVDGETLGQYLARQDELPAWLAAAIAARALEAAGALFERGGLLPAAPLECLRLIQTGPASVMAQVCDFSTLVKTTPARPLKPAFDKPARFLRAMFQEQAGEGPGSAERMMPGTDFAELLAGCLGAAGPDTREALEDLRAEIAKLEAAAGEIPTAHKPRALLAGHLATYQEVARGVVNQVRIQSQRLDMASPYAMRGILTKTGRPVLVEQSPPARMAGDGPLAQCRRALKLDKAKHGCLVPVALVHEADDLACLAEEVVEGIHLAEFLRERRALDSQECYLVLAGLDAALSTLEKSGMETRRLRLEDIYLLTGFSREDPRSAKLLLSKLTDWPAFSIMLRAHPTLASMSGRGLDPAVLLPPAADSTGVWNGSWLAALGSFLLGIEALPGRAAAPEGGARERESAARLLREEIQKAQGRPGQRADFLARFARILQHHDLARSGPAPVTEPLEIKPKPRQQRTVPIGTAAAASMPLPGAPATALTSGFAPETQKPSIGFAELLFRDTPVMETSSGPDWAKTAADAPPTIHTDEVLLPDSDYVPFWLRAAVFVGGSMILGAVFAHFSGHAQWQKAKAPASSPPAAAAAATPVSVPAARQVITTAPEPPAAPPVDIPALSNAPDPAPSSPSLLMRPPGLKEDITGVPK